MQDNAKSSISQPNTRNARKCQRLNKIPKKNQSHISPPLPDFFFQYPPTPDFEKPYLLGTVRIYWKIDPKEKLPFFRGRQVHKLELLFKLPICWRSHCYYRRGQVQNQSILQDFVRTWYDAMKFVIYIWPISPGPGQIKKENTFNRSKVFRASSHFSGVDKQAPTWPGRTSSSLWLERWDENLILIKPLDWIDIYLNLGKHLHIWGWAWRSL